MGIIKTIQRRLKERRNYRRIVEDNRRRESERQQMWRDRVGVD